MSKSECSELNCQSQQLRAALHCPPRDVNLLTSETAASLPAGSCHLGWHQPSEPDRAAPPLQEGGSFGGTWTACTSRQGPSPSPSAAAGLGQQLREGLTEAPG